jgi:RNA polymerase sigma factor (sigma-70 family)
VSTLATATADEVFEDLYSSHAPDVYRYALAVLGNSADAEDVLQTTFLNAYRAVKGGERPRLPRHWLIKIAHNACRTRAIRASRRPREVPLEGRATELAAPETERPDLQPVLDALGTLPFNQRAALVMRELEGRTYEQIAENLGVTVSAVETLIFRARRSLRLRRDALEPLVALPLPASLASFGPATATGGGAALASSAAVKAAALVAALVAGTAALETAHPLASRDSSRDRGVAATRAGADSTRAPTRRPRPAPARSSRPPAPRRAPGRAAPTATVPDPPGTPPAAPPPSAPPSARSAAAASAPQPAAGTGAAPRRGVEQALPRVDLRATVPSVTVALPPAPPLPALPVLPVQPPPLPPAPTVSVPSATVSVPSATVSTPSATVAVSSPPAPSPPALP